MGISIGFGDGLAFSEETRVTRELRLVDYGLHGGLLVCKHFAEPRDPHGPTTRTYLKTHILVGVSYVHNTQWQAVQLSSGVCVDHPSLHFSALFCDLDSKCRAFGPVEV